MKLLPLGAALAAIVVAVVAVILFTGSGRLVPRTPATPVVSAPAASGPYAHAVDVAHQHGLTVWIESDLVKRWLAGPDSFNAAVAVIGVLAARPGVAGIKIADELGYHDGLDTTAKVQSFLRDSRAALGATAPGKLLLADILIPELGCLPSRQPPLRWATICAVQQHGAYPQLSLDAVDGYLRSGVLDVVDISTGLLSAATYAGWGVDTDTAQRAAWSAVRGRGWATLVRVQARKALAHAGVYPGSPAEASAVLTTFVDIPRSAGAEAVDVWTWRQLYQGQLFRLMDPGLRSNALWRSLVARRAAGARLFTHLSPRSLESTLDTDLGVLATAFSDVFLAAGTG